MSSPVIPGNMQVPSETTAPVVADVTVQALRVAYVARRDLERLPEAEWGTPGVLLVTDDGSGQVYVGQAVHVRKRLFQHRSRPKLQWHRAVAMKRDTSHGFNSAEIGYLEGRLAAEIGAIPGVHVIAVLKNLDTTLPAHHMLALDALLPGLFAALRLAGVDLLKGADVPDEPATRNGSKKVPMVIPGTVAGLVAAGLLRAGAERRLSQGGRLASATVSSSGELIVDGVAYASPSKAAATAVGLGSSNAWTTWHVDELGGPTLAHLRAKLAPKVVEGEQDS